MAGKRGIKNDGKRRPIGPELLSTCSDSIRKCMASPRYQVLRVLRFSEILDPSSHAALVFRDMSISDLAELGIQGLVKTDGLISEDVRALIDLLERLSVPFECDCQFEPDEQFERIQPTPREKHQKPDVDAGLLAIEKSGAEMELAAKKQLLKRISSDLLSSKLLSDYWESEWPRAPFEEAMSFKQFSDLDFELLVRKRSFNVHKMHAVSRAIDKFMSEHDVNMKNEATGHSNMSDKPFIPPIAPCIEFQNDRFQLPLIIRNLVRYFEYQCSLYLNAVGPFKILFAHLPLSLKAHEAALLALSVNDAPAFSRRMIGLTKEDFESLLTEARVKLRQLFEWSCPQICSAWMASLASPGSAEEHLFSPSFDDAFDQEFQRMFFRAILQCLGGKHPVVGSETFVELWTLTPDTAEVLAQSLATTIKEDEVLLERLKQCLPAFPADTLLQAVRATGNSTP